MCNFTGERGAIKRGERKGKQINSLSCYEISLDYIRVLVPQLPLRCFDPITIIEKSFFRIFWETNLMIFSFSISRACCSSSVCLPFCLLLPKRKFKNQFYDTEIRKICSSLSPHARNTQAFLNK